MRTSGSAEGIAMAGAPLEITWEIVAPLEITWEIGRSAEREGVPCQLWPGEPQATSEPVGESEQQEDPHPAEMEMEIEIRPPSPSRSRQVERPSRLISSQAELVLHRSPSHEAESGGGEAGGGAFGCREREASAVHPMVTCLYPTQLWSLSTQRHLPELYTSHHLPPHHAIMPSCLQGSASRASADIRPRRAPAGIACRAMVRFGCPGFGVHVARVVRRPRTVVVHERARPRPAARPGRIIDGSRATRNSENAERVAERATADAA